MVSRYWLSVALAAAMLPSGAAQAFSFSDYEEEEAAQEARESRRKADQVRELLSVSCKSRLKGRKVAVIIAERHSNGHLATRQSNYGRLFQEINTRLRAVGLRTYSQEEIIRQIAQAEIEAAFNNDPDAAISASRRLGANFILRGMVSSHSQVNPVVGVNEVFVNMGFTLVTAGGRAISDASAAADSWAGGDTLSVALHLVRQEADAVVARLYHDYCTHGH